MLESPEFRWTPFQWPKPCEYWFSLLDVYNTNMYLVELNYKCSPFSILAETTFATRISPISITNTTLRTLVFQWISSFLDPIHEGLNDWRDGFDVLLLRKLMMIWLWHTMTFIVFIDSKPGYLRHSSLTVAILGQWFWSPFVPCTVALQRIRSPGTWNPPVGVST